MPTTTALSVLAKEMRVFQRSIHQRVRPFHNRQRCCHATIATTCICIVQHRRHPWPVHRVAVGHQRDPDYPRRSRLHEAVARLIGEGAHVAG